MPSQNITKTQLATMNTNVKDYIQNKDGDLSLLENNNLSSEIIIINTDLGTFTGELTDLDTEISTEYGKDIGLLLTLTKTDSTHYAFSQKGIALGTITVPLDNSIESGSLVGTNLSLTLKDGTTEVLDVSSLAENLQISNRNEVNLAANGSTIKDNVVENSNIIDGNITEEKLSLGLQDKIVKAETGNSNSVLQELEDLKDLGDELKTLHKIDEGESLNYYFFFPDVVVGEDITPSSKPYILTKNKGVIFHEGESIDHYSDKLEIVDLNLTAFEEDDYKLWFVEYLQLGTAPRKCCLEDRDGKVLYLEINTPADIITNEDGIGYSVYTEVEPSNFTVVEETLVYAMADDEFELGDETFTIEGCDGLAKAEDIEKLEGLEEIIEQYQALDLKTTDDDFEEYFNEIFS